MKPKTTRSKIFQASPVAALQAVAREEIPNKRLGVYSEFESNPELCVQLFQIQCDNTLEVL